MSGPYEPGWRWFPSIKTDWSLDVVNLLVVIGEQAMIEHAQPITASLLCVLPRIIPAPQVFLKPTRPTRMPEVSAKMTGVYSGTTLDSVGFFANIITPLDEFPAFSFKVLDIRHSDKCQYEDVELRRSQSGRAQGGWLMRTVSRVVPTSKKDEHRKRSRSISAPPLDEETGDGSAMEGDGATARTSARDFASQQQANGNGSASNGHHNHHHHLPHLPNLQRRKTTRQTVQDLLSHPTMAVSGERPAVPARLFSPVHVLGVASFFVSIAIVVCAVIWQDGNAIIAITMISLMSSLSGFASFWRPLLMSRRHTNDVPAGDVMIRTREGAFILIRCTEAVARELYSGTDECQYYVTGRTYRFLMAIGTVLLMISVVLLGNCQWNSQVFIGSSYITLNGLYWGLGMLPRSYFWDLSRYTWEDATPNDAKGAERVTDKDDQREGHPSFTRTLWYAIRETQRTGWVQISGAAPRTEQWKRWLKEAERSARDGKRGWKAVERKNFIMNGKNMEKTADEDEDEADGLEESGEDQAMNYAPAEQVPLQADPGRNRASFF